MQQTPWIERSFPTLLDHGLLPGILERLGGTYIRLSEITRSPDAMLIKKKLDGKWSIQEHCGHLADLESLWFSRLISFEKNEPVLRAADMTNKKTYAAFHNNNELSNLLDSFNEQRSQLLKRIYSLSNEVLLHRSLHPRLGVEMSVCDLCYFVAEHDDHHLAIIRNLKNAMLGDA